MTIGDNQAEVEGQINSTAPSRYPITPGITAASVGGFNGQTNISWVLVLGSIAPEYCPIFGPPAQ
jgi:hypothetical protein